MEPDFWRLGMNNLLRKIPAVHVLQQDKQFTVLVMSMKFSQDVVTTVLKGEMERLREKMKQGSFKKDDPKEISEELFKMVKGTLNDFTKPALKKVINATGTILHTNLGRASLSKEAIAHVIETAENYSNLEYNLLNGKRGSRHDLVEDVLKKLTGAESAMVVNNNAAAVYLILKALANQREVIVSRGQLVEIGGSFRISSIMEESGAQLVEVGTTNKTHLYDYEQAINEQTAILMKVHTSNFKMVGFTMSVETDELVALAANHKEILLYEDLGSGVLFDFGKYGIGDEPVVSQVIETGVDLVSFSGDKLLGGPQAGIIVGKKKWIDCLKKHQLARVLRVDKMTLAALEVTLIQYLKGEKSCNSIPTVRDILLTKEEIMLKANLFLSTVQSMCSNYTFSVIDDVSQVGGGTMPDVELPTVVVAVKHKEIHSELLAKKLREQAVPIIVRIKQGKVLLDFRTVTRDQLTIIASSLSSI